MKPLKACKILVTPTSFPNIDSALRDRLEAEVGKVVYNTKGRPLTSDELARLIRGIDGFIAGLDVIDRQVIEAADCLKVIARYGVGVDAVDLEAARQKGIAVTNVPGANSVSVAELTVGLILALARNIPFASRATAAGQWLRVTGITLEGKVIGLLGLGSVGKEVARRLGGFGCMLIAYDPVVPSEEAQELGVRMAARLEVIREADFLSLHCPLTEETRGMINAACMAEMKDGAYLINTARGELVDETALVEALQRGKLRGAALDVFAHQPPDPAHPLLALKQVIATPHMASHTDGATNAMGRGAIEDCLAVLRGEEPAHRVV